MKPTAFLINTARGAIINEGELIRCMRENVIAGAGLDTLEVEAIHLPTPFLVLENRQGIKGEQKLLGCYIMLTAQHNLSCHQTRRRYLIAFSYFPCLFWQSPQQLN